MGQVGPPKKYFLVLEALVDEALLMWPVGIVRIALTGWAVSALPTFCLGSQRRAEGMRSCLGVLVLLWASMVWSYWLFARSSRVLGYVWSLHGYASILDAWRPAKGVLALRWRTTSCSESGQRWRCGASPATRSRSGRAQGCPGGMAGAKPSAGGGRTWWPAWGWI